MILNIAHQWRQPLSTISTAATGTKLQKKWIVWDEQLNTALTSYKWFSQHLSKIIDDFGEFLIQVTIEWEYNINDILDKTLEIIKSTVHR